MREVSSSKGLSVEARLVFLVTKGIIHFYKRSHSIGIVFVMLRDTYNNNLSLSEAKTSTFLRKWQSDLTQKILHPLRPCCCCELRLSQRPTSRLSVSMNNSDTKTRTCMDCFHTWLRSDLKATMSKCGLCILITMCAAIGMTEFRLLLLSSTSLLKGLARSHRVP